MAHGSQVYQLCLPAISIVFSEIKFKLNACCFDCKRYPANRRTSGSGHNKTDIYPEVHMWKTLKGRTAKFRVRYGFSAIKGAVLELFDLFFYASSIRCKLHL